MEGIYDFIELTSQYIRHRMRVTPIQISWVDEYVIRLVHSDDVVISVENLQL